MCFPTRINLKFKFFKTRQTENHRSDLHDVASVCQGIISEKRCVHNLKDSKFVLPWQELSLNDDYT